MINKRMKLFSILISLSLVATSLISCSKKAEVKEQPASTNGTAASSANFTYPIKSDVTLKYWVELPSKAVTIAQNMNDLPVIQELQKRTGVKVEYIHPATGQAKEGFNLLIASGDLPDIIEYSWTSFPGGPAAAIDNGTILKLNDIFNKYGPNVTKYLKSRPDYEKMVKTDEGNYYVFPFIRDGDKMVVVEGPIVRQDWMDELGLKTPETIDDWYNVLKTMKEKKKVEIPLSSTIAKIKGSFSGGFGVTQGFYNDNGKVKYGVTEPGTKQFFETMHKWYSEGLIDKNFPNLDTKSEDANILSGKSGVVINGTGSGLSRWIPAGTSKDAKFKLNPIAFPTPKRGEIPKFARLSSNYPGQGSAAITTKCKNVELAARLLDYNYTDEGHILMNFGTEGLSYKVENNTYKWTDLITDGKQGDMSQQTAKYTRAGNNGPFAQDEKIQNMNFIYQEQKDAMVVWSKHDFFKYQMPPVTPTVDESAELAKINTEITTYVDEMSIKFILGTEPISNFDKFVENIKKLNIDRAIQIQQSALERYNKR